MLSYWRTLSTWLKKWGVLRKPHRWLEWSECGLEYRERCLLDRDSRPYLSNKEVRLTINSVQVVICPPQAILLWCKRQFSWRGFTRSRQNMMFSLVDHLDGLWLWDGGSLASRTHIAVVTDLLVDGLRWPSIALDALTIDLMLVRGTWGNLLKEAVGRVIRGKSLITRITIWIAHGALTCCILRLECNGAFVQARWHWSSRLRIIAHC